MVLLCGEDSSLSGVRGGVVALTRTLLVPRSRYEDVIPGADPLLWGSGDTGGMPSPRTVDIPIVLRDVTAVAVVVLFGVLPFPAHEFRAEGAMLLLPLLAAALLPFRRRHPLLVFVVASLCAAAAAVCGVVSPGALIAIAIAAFAVAERSSRGRTILVVGLGVLLQFTVNAVPLEGEFFDSRAMQFLLGIVVAAALGDATRSRRAYEDAMRERAERAERGREEDARRRIAEERVRLARDLHDVVAHQLAIISLNAGAASSSFDTRPDQAREALGAVRSASREALTDIGALMSVLRDGEDAVQALARPGLDTVDELVARFTDERFPVTLRRDLAASLPTAASDLLVYLAVQEGLTNALKHGAPGGATVDIRHRDGAAEITVINPITGPAVRPSVGGHGLHGLQERVADIGGTIETDRSAEQFRLLVRIPMGAGAAA